MTTEYKPPLADSIFMEDKSKLITNPSWLLWLSKIASLASGINNATALTIAAGDLLIGSDVNMLSTLAKGTANYKLFMNAGATAPEWANGIKIGTFTRAMDAATGDVAYTGVGFKPSHVVFLTRVETASMVIGVDNGTNHYCVAIYLTPVYFNSSTHSLYAIEAVGKTQSGIIKTLDADGFTLTWTREGATASANATVYYIAFR